MFRAAPEHPLGRVRLHPFAAAHGSLRHRRPRLPIGFLGGARPDRAARPARTWRARRTGRPHRALRQLSRPAGPRSPTRLGRPSRARQLRLARETGGPAVTAGDWPLTRPVADPALRRDIAVHRSSPVLSVMPPPAPARRPAAWLTLLAGWPRALSGLAAAHPTSAA